MPSGRAVLASLACAVIMLLSTTRTARAAGKARLVYLRGADTESCLDDAALRDAVAARLGYEPFTPYSLETLFVELDKVDKQGRGFVARVKLVGVDGAVRGARTIETSGPCSELTSSLALTISLAIDPLAMSRKGPPEGLAPTERSVVIDPPIASASPSPSTPEEPSSADRTPEPAPEPSPRARFGFGAGAIGGIGASPAPSLGFLAFADARYGAFGATLEGRADLPSSSDAEASAGTQGRVSSSLLALSLVPCAHRGPIFACARGAFGRLAAESEDVSAPGSASALWLAAGGRLGGDIALGDTFRLRIHGDADVMLARYVLRIGDRVAFRYPPVAAAIGVALAAMFP